MKRCLTRIAFPERYQELGSSRRARTIGRILGPILSSANITLVERARVDEDLRLQGKDWPLEAETMIGLDRLDNIERCISTLIADGIPGDLIETGVWRGGAVIFMRAVLATFSDTTRTVWVADSFEGLPSPDPAYPIDAGDLHHTQTRLAVSLQEVRANFDRYGLLDEQVRFLKGWFKDTLPRAPIDRLGLIRLDGDMYSSTIEALTALYPKLSVGGFVIVDDYALKGAREAVTDFRRQHRIDEPIETIDWTGAFWRRTS
jgi:O-methyltransferase